MANSNRVLFYTKHMLILIFFDNDFLFGLNFDDLNHYLNITTTRAVNDMTKTNRFEQKLFFELFELRFSIRSGFCSNVVYPGPCMFSDEIDPNPSCSEFSSSKLSSTFCRSVFWRRRFFTCRQFHQHKTRAFFVRTSFRQLFLVTCT